MNTWLIDTPLLKLLSAQGPSAFRRWCEAKGPSLFISVVSLSEIAAAISKTPASQSHRAKALGDWLDGIICEFADRVHSVDPAIALRAGAFLPRLAGGSPRHRLHDATLVATAQIHGHGLLTRRDGVFGSWSPVRVETL